MSLSDGCSHLVVMPFSGINDSDVAIRKRLPNRFEAIEDLVRDTDTRGACICTYLGSE